MSPGGWCDECDCPASGCPGHPEPDDDLPAVGSWAVKVPDAPHSREARTLEIDAEVLELQAHAGMWKMVDLKPGRASTGSSYRVRGCDIKTRHRKAEGATETWARWPVGRSIS